jgi:hypothetical protein
MRYPASDKAEIIQLVEQSHLPSAMSSRGTISPVAESTFCCFSRFPVFRLMRLKLTFSLSDEAGYWAIGPKTSESEGSPSNSRAGPCDTPTLGTRGTLF